MEALRRRWLPGRVRWEIVALLVGFSVVSYVERMNISVAAELMMPQLALTQIQMGQVFSAFLLGYALLQIPMGMFGDKVGSYVVLAAIGWSWAALTFLTGYLPGRFGMAAGASFATLLVIRFLLGCSIAAVYPMAARTVAAWQPVAKRAFSYSFVVTGVFVGSAVTPPIIAWLMATIGWRQSFYVASLLSVAIAVLWTLRGASVPEDHPGVDAAELALIRGTLPAATEDRDLQARGSPTRLSWRHVLSSRSLVLLSISYFLTGYVLYVFVFWFYIYLVEVREFGIVEGGFVAALPFIAAAALSPLGGLASDRGTVRLGRRWGRRLPAMAGPVLGAALLILGARTGRPYLAVAALALSFGLAEFAEGTIWSTAMDIGGPRTGFVTGIINTANNLGGVVSTALMPILVARFGWVTALDSCGVVALIAGLLWLGVDAERPLPGVTSAAP